MAEVPAWQDYHIRQLDLASWAFRDLAIRIFLSFEIANQATDCRQQKQ